MLHDALYTRTLRETGASSADTQSLRTLNRILKSGEVRPSQFHKDYDEAVCLTECTLPGILSHAARYGRYGLIFRKADLRGSGCRPVATVTHEHLERLRKAATTTELKEDCLYYNLYRPDGGTGPRQDYSHEREWRIRTAVPTSMAVAVIVATPAKAAAVRKYSGDLRSEEHTSELQSH